MFGLHAVWQNVASDARVPVTAPLVLVHGWGGSFEATFGTCGWREAAVQARRTVIPIDLPGHGTTTASHDPVDYADLASGLAEQLPPDQLDAIGFSLGGKLLIELAIRHPKRFRRLVVGGVGDNILAAERSADALATALEQGVGADAPGVIGALIRYSQASQSDPLALAAVLRRPPNPIIMEERLRRIQTDILIVNGDADAIALPDSAFLAALPRAKAVHLAGVNHFHLPANDEFQRRALDFLNQSNP